MSKENQMSLHVLTVFFVARPDLCTFNPHMSMKYWNITSYVCISSAPDVDLQEDKVRQKPHSMALRHTRIWQIRRAFSEKLRRISSEGVSDGALPCWWQAAGGEPHPASLDQQQKKNKHLSGYKAKMKRSWGCETALNGCFFICFISMLCIIVIIISFFQLFKCEDVLVLSQQIK